MIRSFINHKFSIILLWALTGVVRPAAADGIGDIIDDAKDVIDDVVDDIKDIGEEIGEGIGKAYDEVRHAFGLLSGPNLLLDYSCRAFRIHYDSYDGNKNKVRLSAMVYIDKINSDDPLFHSGKIKHILLSCHPTVTDNNSSPTGIKPVDEDIQRIVGVDHKSYMVICPDYCGYGITSHEQHPYLIHDITARNCIDAVTTVIDMINNKKLQYKDENTVCLADDYSTDIVGYSQGGATALACAKYLDSDACPEGIKNKVKLHQTTCGDGPYSISATLNQYIEWGKEGKNLEYPCVLPLIVAAAKEAYGEGCMRTVEVEDYFKEDFLKTGIMDLLNSKNVSTDEINAKIIEKMPDNRRPIDIFSDKILDENGDFKTESNEYKCLVRAMEYADLTKGWEPKHQITFYHLDSDRVVPMANYKAVKNGIQNDYPTKVKYVKYDEAHKNVSGIIKWKKNLSNVNFNQVNHADGGVLFYVDYMFGDKLR